ncbi:MAG: hypothetical protein GY898_23615, partial [Proteobacteria bacterium]|nr:hypothetical protein [Pseudomonadota bacterium]
MAKDEKLADCTPSDLCFGRGSRSMRTVSLLVAATAVAMALAAAHCASGSQEGQAQVETSSAVAELIGKSFEDAQQALGKPIQEDRFELGMAVPEFRIELNNFFDAARRAED